MNMWCRILTLFTLFVSVESYTICVAGASSGLGKELIFQGLYVKNYNVVALTNNSDKIRTPYRGEGLDDYLLDNIKDDKLHIYNYNSTIPSYDALILTMGGSAFEKNDFSYDVTENLLNNIDSNCKSVVLISAYGVGSSIEGANIGIIAMKNWYLKNVYISKEKQEKLLKKYRIKQKIYRPKVLSYGDTPFESTSREKLAETILNNL